MRVNTSSPLRKVRTGLADDVGPVYQIPVPSGAAIATPMLARCQSF